MTRGHPDWLLSTGNFGYFDADMSELVARIGGGNVYRRSGRVIYTTGFECDIDDWVPYDPSAAGAGTNGAAARWTGESGNAPKRPLRGSASLKLTPASTGDGDGIERMSAIKLLPAIWNGNLGYEVELAFHEDATGFVLQLSYDDAGVIREAGIMVDLVNADLLYRSTVGGFELADFTKFADLPSVGQWQAQAGASLRWAHLKLIVSSELDKYLAFYLNQHAYDLSAVSIPTGTYGVGAFERIAVQLVAIDLDGTQGPSYVDDVIVTQDEVSPVT